MAVTIYYEKDCDPSIIQGKKVAIIGYGSGHAHALNLADSGVDVRVGSREVPSPPRRPARARPQGNGHGDRRQGGRRRHHDPDPDETQPKVYEEHIEPTSSRATPLAFAHGFNIHYGYIKAPRASMSSWLPLRPGRAIVCRHTPRAPGA